MSDSDEALLDRPIWSALTTSHKHLAEGGPLALRYPVDMTPFADMVDMSTTSFEALGDLMSPSQVAALFTPEPVDVPSGFKVVIAETGEQMIGSPADSPLRDAEIVTLGKADVPAMTALTTLTKPGPFAARTHELGTFLGIRAGGELVAMTGERMKPGKFVEMTASTPTIAGAVTRRRCSQPSHARSRRAAKFRSCTCSRTTIRPSPSINARACASVVACM